MSVSVTAKQVESALQATQQASDPSLAQQGEKFSSMMKNHRMAKPEHADGENTNVVSKLVAAQDAEIQQSVNDVVQFSQQAPQMSMNEIMAATTKMTLEMASTQLDMEAKMGVVDSSKSAIETLMKNQ
ncbi:type III secretion protein HrpB2 [Paraburkholderia kururiensis]|uniref:Type III secretion protein HrpB2 n=1 Tax=Paraburkholderia kururiensis TaxID=984307 RepID=A0ABZ0WQI6_9BURK|nr:type III secretion protein HrpB2 [Paraburkholderia kururiensis]WQD79643.1 type III secretion protein HrpB2 [Paraburkholderia kururiensis]